VAAAERIAARGLRAVPHVAARTLRSDAHLRALLDRLGAAGVDAAFFPGGDAPRPAGPFPSAVALLHRLAELDHGLTEIGVAAYPEGHPEIPPAALEAALLAKQPVATFMSSQNCFDPGALVAWLERTRAAGVTLPLLVGVPGVVPMRRLLDALREYGLADALRYLRKQPGTVRALAAGRFSPGPFVAALGTAARDPALGIAGLHVFTFQEIAATEAWRRAALA